MTEQDLFFTQELGEMDTITDATLHLVRKFGTLSAPTRDIAMCVDIKVPDR